LTPQSCSVGLTSLTFFEKEQKRKAIEAPLRAYKYRDIAMASPSEKVSPPRMKKSNREEKGLDECGRDDRFGIRAKGTHELTELLSFRSAFFPIIQP
jgi:hypothetical protein